MIGPMYIAEISPAARRGRLVGLFQMNVVVGILLAYLSNSLVASAGFGESEWRWKFGMVAIPAAAFLFALVRNPGKPSMADRGGPDGSEPAKYCSALANGTQSTTCRKSGKH